jgi:hypothetical protein
MSTTLPIDPLEVPRPQHEDPLSNASKGDGAASGFGPVKRKSAKKATLLRAAQAGTSQNENGSGPGVECRALLLGAAGITLGIKKTHLAYGSLTVVPIDDPSLEGYVAHARLQPPYGRPLELIGSYMPCTTGSMDEEGREGQATPATSQTASGGSVHARTRQIRDAIYRYVGSARQRCADEGSQPSTSWRRQCHYAHQRQVLDRHGPPLPKVYGRQQCSAPHRLGQEQTSHQLASQESKTQPAAALTTS